MCSQHDVCWIYQLVRDISQEEEATNILTVPTRADRDDCIHWHFDRKGVFLVKSAYHVLEDREQRMKKQHQGEGSLSSRLGDAVARQRKQIQKFQCPPKVKQFVWRLAHNNMPMKMNIKQRGIDLDTRCLVCMRFDEDGGHCFLKYKFAGGCWRELRLDAVWTSL